LSKELLGWNEDVLETKIANLARMIALMNKNKGPEKGQTQVITGLMWHGRPGRVLYFLS